jgi:exodeoxyribonuclease VII large subunit
MSLLFNQSQRESDTWSVSELNVYLRELFEIDFRLQDIDVSGEISNFTRARSGHVYFTLKDEQAQLRCVMWRSSAERLQIWPEDGDAVIVHGRISVYEAGGVYQLYADSLTPAGRGELAQAFERLKNQLAAEGLFDEAHKKPIPRYPEKIGIVTSADAAALRDIINVLRRRWPVVAVLVAPTLVQGADAPAQIVAALRWLDGRNDIDTIIITRGGGSIEDLWAFNDESVARTVFASQLPIISGVGHETDFTIVDFVADLRAPTPSAAAELAVPDQFEVLGQFEYYKSAIAGLAASHIGDRRIVLSGLFRTLKQLSPGKTIDANRQNLDWLSLRLDAIMQSWLEAQRTRLTVAMTALEAVGPLATLARGYAIVHKEDGQILKSKEDVTSGDSLDITVSDGTFSARVDERTSDDR